MTTKTTHRKLVALDFDGVLHSYTSPWTDAATIADPPTPGAMQFLQHLVEDRRFEVVIVSSRLNDIRGRPAIRDWLIRHAMRELGQRNASWADRIEFSEKRPPAFLTIDDRGWQFDGTWPDLDVIAGFKPWNKRPPAPARASVYTHRPGDGEAVRHELESRGVLWPIGGHAPGDRYLRCYDCSWTMFGDERTIRCLRCAVVAVRDQHDQDVAQRNEIAVELAEREEAVGIYDQADHRYPQFCVDARQRLRSYDEAIERSTPLVAMLEGLPS